MSIKKKLKKKWNFQQKVHDYSVILITIGVFILFNITIVLLEKKGLQWISGWHQSLTCSEVKN